MKILAFDVATRLGYGIGVAGRKPHSAAIRLKKTHEPLFVATSNAGFLTLDLVKLERPDLIACEAPIHPTGHKSPESVLLAWGSVTAIKFVADLYEIRFELIKVDDLSEAFVGKCRWSKAQGGRDAKKKAYIERAHLFGLLDQDVRDTDRADACAVHWYASRKWGGIKDEKLYLFGEQAA